MRGHDQYFSQKTFLEFGEMIIILAGGKSIRMGMEKPVLEIAGKEMLLWIYEEASKVDDVLVALSKNTPKTKKLCVREGIPYVETPGEGYVEDIRILLQEFGHFVSVSADIPFVKAGDLELMRAELNKREISLTGVLPLDLVPRYIRARVRVHEGFVITGVNAVAKEGEGVVKLSNPLLALNVNTLEDLKLAQRMARLLKVKSI